MPFDLVTVAPFSPFFVLYLIPVLSIVDQYTQKRLKAIAFNFFCVY